MKKSIFTLALAFIALFGFNTVSAQSLSQYEATFNATAGDLTLKIMKVGGYGSKTAQIKVDLYMEIKGTIDCEKIQGKNADDITYRTFKREADGNEAIDIPRTSSTKGSLTLNPIKELVLDGSGFECPGGWNYNGGAINAEVGRVWVVMTSYDSKGAVIGTPQEQELVVSGLPLAQ